MISSEAIDEIKVMFQEIGMNWPEPEKSSVKLKRNWLLKNSWNTRRLTLSKLRNLKIGSCDCCVRRFPVWWHSEREGQYFQGNGCAADLSYYDKIDMHTVTTGYGSDFDGSVFVVNDPAKFSHVSNVCDICLCKGIVAGDFEYLYNYMIGGLRYNPKFKDRIITAFGDKMVPVEDRYLNNIIDYAHKLLKD
jgi:hypothetical protein